MTPLTILQGDVLEQLAGLPGESVHCCVTSPPYWGLRDYGVPGQIGLEPTPQEYVAKMVSVFREVRRVLRKDGVCCVNLGDSYNGSQQTGGTNSISGNGASQPHGGILKKAPSLKPKDLCGIPWRVAFALQEDGWWLRQDIIWAKPNPMPESVRDRCTKAHEYVFMLTKSARYWWDAEAIAEPSIWHDDSRNGKGRLTYDGKRQGNHGEGQEAFVSIKDCRNRRSVWTITTQPYPEAHFATFPEELPKLCILASCPPGGTVLDPFAGSGTVGKVALELGRRAVLIELNPEYVQLIRQRCAVTPGFAL